MTEQRDDLRDVGSTSLSVVLTAPVLVALMFCAFQAAMWNHTRAVARVIASETAVLVARDHVSADAAVVSARAALAAAGLGTEQVDVGIVGTDVVVSIRVQAPGILRGTSTTIDVTAAVGLAGWTPL